MYLVMLETNGNQRYIFSSPRLRESIGASAQLVRLKQWTDSALMGTGANAPTERHKHAHPTSTTDTPDAPADLDFVIQHPEWVSRASGKVIFMVKTEALAKTVIGRVTRTALAQAPGIDVSGVYIDMGDRRTVDEGLLKKVHAEAAAYALRRSPAQARFSQMPFLDRAKDSSLPAAPPLSLMLSGGLKGEANDDLATALSLSSRIKRYQAYPARKHLIRLAVDASSVLKLDNEADRLVRDPTGLKDAYSDLREKADERMLQDTLQKSFVTGLNADAVDEGADAASNTDDVKDLERAFQDGKEGTPSTGNLPDLSKVAVIHADGNGVGAIMRNLETATSCVPPDAFQKELGCQREDGDAFRRFSLSVSTRLDRAVTGAFAAAWTDVAIWAQVDAWLHDRDFPAVPVVPVILGGDDVTVITSGDYALPFAASFLTHFEKQTEDDNLLKYLHGVDKVAAGELQPKDVTPGPMTAAAGVAIVRRNFPFHIAYELAEKLVSRAKGVGKNENPPCSTLDFHVLFDTTVIDPDDQLGGYSKFTTRPFRFVKPTLAASETGPTSDVEAPSTDTAESRERATWEDTCRRVARFRGFRTNDVEDRIGPFPRTRAARIRKLLSDGKHEEATQHWDDAQKAIAIDPDIVHAGHTALFDLLELADLLPDSYLQEATGLTPPDTSTNPTSTPAEAHS